MADCFITRRGGGGSAGLNFKVVGGTAQPENPKENTIWINTDAEITSWVVSMTEPTAPVEGMVWLQTNDSSEVEFNALKKNAIQLCLTSVFQYVNGSWIEKSASIYQNGAWIEVSARTYLFINGDECNAITGGWDGGATINDSGQMVFKTSSNINSLYTLKKISKGAATKLCVNIASISVFGSGDFNIVLGSVKDTTDPDYIYADLTTTTNGVKSLDISKVSSSFYVHLYSYMNAKVNVDKVWLE